MYAEKGMIMVYDALSDDLVFSLTDYKSWYQVDVCQAIHMLSLSVDPQSRHVEVTPGRFSFMTWVEFCKNRGRSADVSFICLGRVLVSVVSVCIVYVIQNSGDCLHLSTHRFGRASYRA